MAGKPYHIALSFAGEDRGYVELVADGLRQRGVHVFYDQYEEATLWGKDLYTHLDDIYRKKACFTIAFISEHYRHKLWANHERRSAQARAFEENREYILPARFDSTEIPGVPNTIGYIDLNARSPDQLCDLVIKKLSAAGIKWQRVRYQSRHGGLFDENYDDRYARFGILSRDAAGAGRLDTILIDASQYSSFGEILNDIFENDLVNQVGPFSYGLEWLVTGAPDGWRALVPWRWIRHPAAVHDIDPAWAISCKPSDLGIQGGSYWSIDLLNRRAIEKGIHPHGVRKKYALATSNEDIWKAMITEPKAVAMLLREGYLAHADLDVLETMAVSRIGVFFDWLSVGREGALVETGKDISALKSIYRRYFR